MNECSACLREIPADSRVCCFCGVAVDRSHGPQTVTAPRDRGAPAHGSGSSSDSIDQARFTPGAMLTERYRVVGLLGKGGMGEVYRADDLKLRQSVALKFLPPALSKDPRKLERFHHEVRVARQVSHPNVCRVYDIGEANGQQFLTMEYIDGEDLASLLRRIGRPSNDKAVQIARQLCAGLAAAHDKGVLHRDLKPHNVMIDGQGRARITDFGLAGFVEEFAERQAPAGTPAYMAPEQLAGRQVSVKSDIYALGLVLFELFTGRRATEGTTPDRLEPFPGSAPTTLPSLPDDLDPVVERVILRCLEREPSARPSSAMAVAAALPGGDPLAAALEAGETPDPSMVAAAGGIGGLRPIAAVSCLAAVLIGVALVALWVSDKALYRIVLADKSPQDLAVHARGLLKEMGYIEQPPHQAFGFAVDFSYTNHLTKEDQSPHRLDRLGECRPPAMFFWYRQSADYLSPHGLHAPRVTHEDPPLFEPGSTLMGLDPTGRLTYLESIPTEQMRDAVPGGEFDWAVLFQKAELDLAAFQEVELAKAPRVPCDVVRAWRGAYPRPEPATAERSASAGADDGASQGEIVVQAGTFRGRPTYFEIIGPWNAPHGQEEEPPKLSQRVADTTVMLVAISVILGAVLLARRNLRLGRSDRRGAFRLSVFILASMLISWCLMGIQLRTVDLGTLSLELLFDRPLGHALVHACLAWALYIALEPYARRLWPGMLVSWSRLLMGRFRDPLIGRDLLIGSLCALVVVLLPHVSQIGAVALGAPPDFNYTGFGSFDWSDPAKTLGSVVYTLQWSVISPMIMLVALLVARAIVRRTWASVAIFMLVPTILAVIGALDREEHRWDLVAIEVVVTLALVGLTLFVLMRFGLVAAISQEFASGLIGDFPITFDFSTWYAGATLLASAVLVGVAVFGFYTARAGQPLFRDTLFDT